MDCIVEGEVMGAEVVRIEAWRPAVILATQKRPKLVRSR